MMTQAGVGAPLEESYVLTTWQCAWILIVDEGTNGKLRGSEEAGPGHAAAAGSAFALFAVSLASRAPPTRLPAHGEICLSLFIF